MDISASVSEGVSLARERSRIKAESLGNTASGTERINMDNQRADQDSAHTSILEVDLKKLGNEIKSTDDSVISNYDIEGLEKSSEEELGIDTIGTCSTIKKISLRKNPLAKNLNFASKRMAILQDLIPLKTSRKIGLNVGIMFSWLTVLWIKMQKLTVLTSN